MSVYDFKVLNQAGEEVSLKEYEGKVLVCKVNVDENFKVPSQFGIRAIPTLIVFKNGEAVEQRTGALPKDQIVQLLQSKALA